MIYQKLKSPLQNLKSSLTLGSSENLFELYIQFCFLKQQILCYGRSQFHFTCWERIWQAKLPIMKEKFIFSSSFIFPQYYSHSLPRHSFHLEILCCWVEDCQKNPAAYQTNNPEVRQISSVAISIKGSTHSRLQVGIGLTILALSHKSTVDNRKCMATLQGIMRFM